MHWPSCYIIGNNRGSVGVIQCMEISHTSTHRQIDSINSYVVCS